MKKAIVLLLALAVIGGAVFAQDAPALKFSGYLNVGGQYVAPADGSDATWAMNGYDSGTGGRFNLGASYNAGDYGVTLRMREQDSWAAGNAGSLMVRRLYGWFNLFDGKAKIQAGRLGDYAWATGSGNWNAYGSVDGPVGIQLQIKPVDGLNFGIFIPTTGVATGTFADSFGSSLLAASYTIKGIGDFQVGYQMKADVAAVVGKATSEIYKATGKEKANIYVTYTELDKTTAVLFSALVPGELYIKWTAAAAGNVAAKTDQSYPYFGFQYTGMENLTAAVEGKMAYLGDDTTGYTYLRWNFGYVMDALDVSLAASQQIFNDSAMGLSLVFSPNVAYTVSDIITAEVGGTYAMNDKMANKSGYEIAADVAFNLKPSQTLRIGGAFDGGDAIVGLGDLDTRAADNSESVFGARLNDYSVFIDFVWNF